VLFSVPGAFTVRQGGYSLRDFILIRAFSSSQPTCHVNHLPPYLQKYDEFKGKGVDVIAVLASNDPFVMSGWGRFQDVKDKVLSLICTWKIPIEFLIILLQILCLSDIGAEWSNKLGLALESPGGARTARYAIILDDLVIKYIEV